VAAVRRGDVMVANLDPTIGVEIQKTRPVIVVSNESINRFSQLVVVVPLTKNVSHLSPSHAVIPRGTARLAFASKAVTEQIKAVDKSRLVKRLGSLPPPLLAQVERALKNTLAFSH
jgi:mRNA interferase MazF